MMERPRFAVTTGPSSDGWMSTLLVEASDMPTRQHAIAIAIPARDEAESIIDCLVAIEASVRQARQRRVSVMVFVNNSRDATAARARAFRSQSMGVSVVEEMLPKDDAHAGGARRRAFNLALGDLPPGGVMMTTDADSRVEANWIAANLAEIEAGADAVAGVITFAPDASLCISAARHAEWQLAHLQARLHSLLDPRPQARWPTHIWAWGASLAVRAEAYCAVGGLPAVPLAEDRAFVDILDRHGFRVRRSHLPLVVTSHRRNGRAPGGLADLVAAYAHDTLPCDAALEPTATLARRLVWRTHLRAWHSAAGTRLSAPMATRLAIDPDRLACGNYPAFGHWWAAIEQASPRLVRRRVLPADLPTEIARAERLISLFGREAHRGGNSPYALHAVA